MPNTVQIERKIDQINTKPRFTDHDAFRLNQMFRGSSTMEMLQVVVQEGLAGELVMVSSFGAESAVLLHHIASVDKSIPILFLETDKHFPETLSYRDELVRLLGLTNQVNVFPEPDAIRKRDGNGLRWSYDPDGCCELRKTKPLAKAMYHYDASLTGRKAFQSSNRASLPRFEIDKSDFCGRLKINPLIDWDKQDIEDYFSANQLPKHPLSLNGYPSIGCSPCTSKVEPGEDPRSGRWKGWDKTECGIHSPLSQEEELPPGYEPFL